jgi:hypothetical protein
MGLKEWKLVSNCQGFWQTVNSTDIRTDADIEIRIIDNGSEVQ